MWKCVSTRHPRKKLHRPRWLQKLYALLFGYFWIPCPTCGNMFGGHEWGASLMISWRRGIATCPECVEETRRLNDLWMDAHPDEVKPTYLGLMRQIRGSGG